jgi:hypothetical protein
MPCGLPGRYVEFTRGACGYFVRRRRTAIAIYGLKQQTRIATVGSVGVVTVPGRVRIQKRRRAMSW